MDIKDLFSGFGESSLFGRPYKIKRFLFFFFSLLVLAFVGFLYFNNDFHDYAFSSCSLDEVVESSVFSSSTPCPSFSCRNVVYGSDVCEKSSYLKDKPICITECIVADSNTRIASIGEMPPWYIREWTLLVLGSYLLLLLINTLLYNRHLFSKPSPDEKLPDKDIFRKMVTIIGNDGKEVSDEQKDNHIVKESEGIIGDSTIHSNPTIESTESRIEPEVKSGEACSVEGGLESDGEAIRDNPKRRFGKRSNNARVPPSS